MRNTFIEHLIRKAELDDRVFLIVGDLGFSVVEPYVARFPDRYLNAGVAEQNMTSVAAGLAREGYRPFTYSIGNFSTVRCLEQIRNDVCYHKLPVCVVAVGGGYMYGPLGPTHHATEDIAILRTLPGMRVFVPFGKASTCMAVDEILAEDQPAYLRLGRADVEREPADNGVTAIVTAPGNRRAILSVGQLARDVLERGRAEARDVYAWCRIKPLPEASLRELVTRYEEILVVEDHQREGGAFSAFSEFTSSLKSESIRGRFSPHVCKETEQRKRMIQLQP
ncbi:MAG TPA: transketolase [Kiritimatiellia bacterium]|nr:transketolase [Kiritimatiellia bacterium]